MKSVVARRTVLSLAILSSLAILAALWAFYLIPTTQAQPQVGPAAASAQQPAPAGALAEGSWTAQTSGTSETLYAVHFVDADNGWAVGETGTILKTTDGGANWTAQTSGVTRPLYGVHFVDANTGWIAGGVGTILKTTDGGANWTAQTSGTGNDLYGVHFVDANNGWVVASGGVIRHTSNGGTDWSAQTSGTTEFFNGVHFVNANTGWAVGRAGTIVTTANGGTNWTAQTSGTSEDVEDVHFVDANTGWATGDEGLILNTTDGGANWAAQTSGSAQRLRGVRFVDANNGWVVGSAGTIVGTSDGGANWAAQTSGTSNTLYGTHFVGGTAGWAVGVSGTILKFAAVIETDLRIEKTVTAASGNGDTDEAGNLATSVFDKAYITSFSTGVVDIVDLTDNTVSLGAITVGSQPNSAAFSPDGSKIYVTNRGDRTVSVIDTTTNTVSATIPVGATALGAAFTGDGAKAYVANFGDNTVSVIDVATNAVIKTISGFVSPGSLVTVGDRVYVSSLTGGGSVFAIDTGTDTVVETITSVGSSWGMAVNPAGTKLYVAAQDQGGVVAIVDLASATVEGAVTVGGQPQSAEVTPDGSLVYLTSLTTNNVSVVDTASKTVVANISVGSSPYVIGISRDGTRAYAVNFGTSNMSVIDTASNTVIDTLTLSTGPFMVGTFKASTALTAQGADLTAGRGATYTITVTNDGPNAASGVVIRDTLPSGLGYVSNDGGCSVSGQEVTCTIGNLAVDATATVAIAVSVPANTADGSTATNTAAIIAINETDATTTNNTFNLISSVGREADLSVTKADSPDPVKVGENLTYTINVTNSGPSDASGTVVTDTLPANVTFTSATPSQGSACSEDSGTVTCNLGELVLDATASVVIVVVPQAAAEGTATNTVAVTSDETDPDSANSTVSITTTVVGVADLAVIKSVSSGSSTLDIFSTVAGTGGTGLNGDGGPATSATIDNPYDVFIDRAGNMFIADGNNNAVRRVDGATGIITTVAGTGASGATGDGGPATSATMNQPYDVVVDGAGNLFISDKGNHAIRRVDASSSIITTYAGTIGSSGSTGDGGPATSARLTNPDGIALDAAGNLYISGVNNSVIRRVDAVTGIITTVAGTMSQTGYEGDDGPATSAKLKFPGGVTVDAAGNLFIADTGNAAIRRVDAVSGVITTVAGTGTRGLTGDGGPATSATIESPQDVAVDAAGNIYIIDWGDDTFGNDVIRWVDGATGIMNKMAVTDQQIKNPYGGAVDASGNLFIADTNNHAVRKVAPETFAGTDATYTVSVINNGPSNAVNTEVTDTLGTGLTFKASGSSESCSAEGQTVTCTLGTLANDATASVTIIATIASDFTNGGTATNTVIVSSASTDATTTDNTAAAAFTVVQPQSDLAVTKDATSTASAGTDITYTVTVTNDGGPSAARGVTITDTLPTGLTHKSNTGDCEVSGQTVTCSIGTLAADATASVSIVATIDSGFADGGTAANGVAVTLSNVDPDSTNNAATNTVTVVRETDVRVEKTSAADSLVAGENAVYTVTVTNDGPSDASNVIFKDTLPAGLTYADIPPPFDFGDTATAISTGGNNVFRTRQGDFDGDGKQDIAFLNHPVVLAQLDVVWGDPAGPNNGYTSAERVFSGGAMSTLAVGDLNGDGIDDMVTTGPDVYVFLGDASRTIAPRLTTSLGNATQDVAVGELTGDANLDVVVAANTQLWFYKGNGDGTLQTGVQLGGASGTVKIGDFNGDGNSDILQAHLDGTDGLVIWEGDGAGGFVQRPEFVDDRNTNVSPWQGVSVADFNNDGMSDVVYATDQYFVVVVLGQADLSAALSQHSFYDFPQTNSGESWDTDTGDFNGDGNLDVVFTTYVNSSGAGNHVFLMAMAGRGDATFETPIVYGPSARGLDIVVNDFDDNGTLDVGYTFGGTLSYVDNNIPSGGDADPVECTVSGQEVTCTVDALAKDATARVSIGARVPSSTVEGTAATNTAAIISVTETDPNNANDSASVGGTVAREVDLSITKTDDPDPVSAGNNLTYTITVTNNGPSDASGTTVVDTLPANVTYTSATPSQGSCSESSGTVTCDLGDVTADATATVVIVVVPLDAAVGEASNVATVTSDETDTDNANNTTTITTTVAPAADLSVTKELGPAGDPLSLVKDIHGSGNSDPDVFVEFNDALYFRANDGVNGLELWKSDGTADGTVLFKDINPGGNSFPGDLTVLDGVLYFGAEEATNGLELWKSDGTAGGTVLVKDINTSGHSEPTDFFLFNNVLYFTANDGSSGIELWKSDGTAGGTSIVKDINGSGDSAPQQFIAFDNAFYFTANDGTNGAELWKSDGTAGGTSMVKDINGSGGSHPDDFEVFNNTLYFRADDGVNGAELWKSDGTSGGTQMVKDINGAGGSTPGELIVFNNALYFKANDGINGMELWKSDGTDGGTILVKDINPLGGSDPRGLIVLNNVLYFQATDGVNGQELWKSDGTAGGTQMVKDINPSGNSRPDDLVAFNNTLYFEADDGTNGKEVWKSDGTGAGTRMVGDINPSGNSDPTNFTVFDNALYFRADDGTNGRELWRLVELGGNTITTVAGTLGISNGGSTGDGGPATAAKLNRPPSLYVDAAGNIFIADNGNHAIRRVDASTGIITTVAGTLDVSGSSGDGGLATNATLEAPSDVAVDAAGNIFIADTSNYAVRRVDASTGIITTVAGTLRVQGASGDGGPATSAELDEIYSLAVDADGNIFIADYGNSAIRKVDASTGIITTVAGTLGVSGSSGDGGAATSATLNFPLGVAVDADGNLIISDTDNATIRRVDASTGIITTVAGTVGVPGSSGDSGPATSAKLKNAERVAVDADGNIFIADSNNSAIRMVDASTGIIDTVAGTGSDGAAGDGGPATSAGLNRPNGVALDADGNLFIADTNNNAIRKVTAAKTIAGTDAAYTITVVNNGPGAATNVEVVDTLPAGFTHVRDDGGCAVSGQVVTCDVGGLDADSAASIVVGVSIADNFVDGATATNTVAVTADEFDPDTSNNDFTLGTTVVREADLGVDKEISGPGVYNIFEAGAIDENHPDFGDILGLGVALGDINGDDVPDLITAFAGDPLLFGPIAEPGESLFEGTEPLTEGVEPLNGVGDGTATLAWYEVLVEDDGSISTTRHDIDSSSTALFTDPVAADVDDDGNVDVVVNLSAFLGFGFTAWYRNTGGGAFEGPFALGDALGGFTTALDAGDLDRDGDVDVLQGSLGGFFGLGQEDGLVWLEQDGDATDSAAWTAHTLSPIPAFDAQIADMTGDGHADVLAVLFGDATSSVVVFENQGGGSFQAQTVALSQENQSERIFTAASAADLDMDGDLDILGGGLTAFGENPVAGAAWFENDGAGDFGFNPLAPGANLQDIGQAWRGFQDFPVKVAAGDIDLDGSQDVVVMGASGLISYAAQPTAGSFNPFWPILLSEGFAFELAFFGDSLIAHDLNEDGLLDLMSSGLFLLEGGALPPLVHVNTGTEAAVAGLDVTYTVNVVNNGPSVAGVEITDTLPAGLSYVSSDGGCTVSGQDVTCNIGNLDVDASVTIAIVVSLADNFVDGATATNTVAVTADEFDPDTSNNDFTLGTTVVREADLQVGKEVSGGAAHMYWVDHATDKIQRANLDGGNVEDLVTTGLDTPLGLALDLASGKMYWTDAGTGKIQRADLDGNNVEDVVTGLGGPWGLALDLAGQKMYWTESGPQTISRADISGDNIEQLIGGMTAVGIALDVPNNKMYLANHTAGFSIRKADLDGSNLQDIVTGLDLTQLIALDLTSGKVYWASEGAGKVQRADLDGSNVEDVATALDRPYAVALDTANGKMYWTNRTGSVHRADLDGTNVEDLVTGLTDPLGMALLSLAPSLTAGEDATYTISVTNAGPSAASSVEITDTLPAGFSFVSSEGTCTASGQVVTCDVGELAADANAVVVIVAHVASDFTDGGRATNRAAITGVNERNPNATNDSVSLTNNVVREVDLQVQQAQGWWPGEGDATDIVGNNDGTLVNGATADAVGQFGTAFNFDGTSHADFGTIFPFERTDPFSIEFWIKQSPTVTGNNFVIARQDNFGGGGGYAINSREDGTIQFYLKQVSDQTGLQAIGSTNIRDGNFHHVAVTYDGSSSGSGMLIYIDGVLDTPEGGSGTLASTTVGPEPFMFGAREGATFWLFDGVLDEVKVHDRTLTACEIASNALVGCGVIAGTNTNHIVTVVNAGPSDASGVEITDTLPVGVSYVSSDGACTVSGQDVTCDVGNLAADASATVTIVVRIDEDSRGAVSNTVAASATEADPEQSNNSASAANAIEAEVDLELVALEALPQVDPLDSFSYLLEITNQGPSQATQTMLTLDVAAGVVTFLNATPSQGTCTENSNVLTCDFGPLNSDATATVSIGFLARDSESVKTAITDVNVAAFEPDTVLGNNELQLLTRVKGEPADDSGPVALPRPVPPPAEELIIVPDEQVSKVEPTADDEVTKVIQPDRHNVIDFTEEKLRVIFPSHVLNKTFQVRVRQREEDCTVGRSPNGQMLRCITVDLFDTDASELEDAQLFFNATLAVILTDAEIELLGGPEAAFAAWTSGELRFQRHNPGNLARPWSDVTTSFDNNGEISAPALNHFSTFALVYSPGQPSLPPPPPNTKPGPILPDVGDASLGGGWSLLLTIGGALSLLAGGILLLFRPEG